MKKRVKERLDTRLEPVVKNAVAEGVCSGLAVGISTQRKGGGEKYYLVEGRTSYEEVAVRIDRTTLFDLASLTKPLCTALGIALLIERNQLAWKSRISDFLPFEVTTLGQEITVDQVLTHSAGFLAYKPLYSQFPPELNREIKDKLIRFFLEEERVYAPGTRCLYSDIGFLLLGEVIEQVAGLPLDLFFKKEIAVPLGIDNDVLFVRLPGTAHLQRKVAATEQCGWRNRLMYGEVHDEHAWLLNGVAGHAGLFGSIDGVLAMTEAILALWKGRRSALPLSQPLLAFTLTRKYQNCSWCRGFDTPAPVGSSAGTRFSEASVGHLGYTGTSFWIDPVREITVVLLTNRVHPTRNNERIKAFRPLLHDAVMEVLSQ